MVIKSMEIKLTKESASYYSGETITGACEITIADSDLEVANMEAVLQSQCKVAWSVGTGPKKTFYTDYGEIFPDVTKQLPVVNGVLEPGSHKFPFEFAIPPK